MNKIIKTRRFVEKYSWGKVIDEFEGILEDAVEKKRGRVFKFR